ncbi:MAG: RNA polymerase sigma factor [Planctomycetota bacterium]
MPDPAGSPRDAAAFAAGLEALAPRLVGWSHLRLRGRAGIDPDDLAQEVVCRALAGRDRFAGSDLAAWVFQIARHVLMEWLRSRQRRSQLGLGEGHGSQFDLDDVTARLTTLTRKIAQRDDIARLLAMAQQLDAIDHVLLLSCGLEGVAPAAAAAQVGLAEEAARKRWYRLRQRLQAAATVLVADPGDD